MFKILKGNLTFKKFAANHNRSKEMEQYSNPRTNKIEPLIKINKLLKLVFPLKKSELKRNKIKSSKQVSLIARSSHFDAKYYLRNNPDLAKMEIDPAEHFFLFGGFEGRNPSPSFNTNYYLSQNPDVAKSRANPLVHFILYGEEEGRIAIPSIIDINMLDDENADLDLLRKSDLFDEDYYLEMYPDILNSSIYPLNHYLDHGWKEGRNPSKRFDTNFYLSSYQDVNEANINPLVHFIRFGKEESRAILPIINSINLQSEVDIDKVLLGNSKLFNVDYYLKMYPDIRNAKVDPLTHYIEYGWSEGRNPSEEFDTNFYLSNNEDVKNARINPLLHFIKFGEKEGRKIKQHDFVPNNLLPSGLDVIFICGINETKEQFYRVQHHVEAFRNLGLSANWFQLEEIVENITFLCNTKILFFWRTPYSNEYLQLINYARKYKIPIIYDVDDFYFDSNKVNVELIDVDKKSKRGKKEIAKYCSLIVAALNHADLCICPNVKLKNEIERTHNEAIVMQNGFNLKMIESAIKTRQQKNILNTSNDINAIKIGCYISTLNLSENQKFLVPALLTILSEYPTTKLILFESSSTSYNLEAFSQFYHRVEIIKNTNQIQNLFEFSDIDVFILPPTLNDYTGTFSETIFIETALLHIPVIASSEYTGSILLNENCLIVHSKHEWISNLKMLISNSEMRKNIGKNAFNTILWEYGPEKRIQRVLALISDISPNLFSIIEHGIARKKALVIKERAEKLVIEHKYIYPHISKFDTVISYNNGKASNVGVIFLLQNNHPDLLITTLDTIKNQTLYDIDLVLIGDNSTQLMTEKAKDWLINNNRRFNQSIVIQSKTKSPGQKLNDGFDYLETQFILPLYQNVGLYPDCIWKCMSVLYKSGAAFVYPRLLISETNGDLRNPDFNTNIINELEWNFDNVINGNYSSALTLFSKASWSSVGGFDTLIDCEEFVFQNLLMKQTKCGFFGINIPKILGKLEPKDDDNSQIPILKKVKLKSDDEWLKVQQLNDFAILEGHLVKTNRPFVGSKTILFIGHDDDLAGAQVLLLSLISWIQEKAGFEVKIILLNGRNKLIDKFTEIAPVLFWDDFTIKNPDKKSRQFLLNTIIGKVDLVYGNTVLSTKVYDELAYLEVPFISHIHELEMSIRFLIDDTTKEKMRQLTNYFIACSKPVAFNLLNNYNIAPSKISTVNEFVKKIIVNEENSKSLLRKKLHLIEDGTIIIGCGTISYRKGVDLFIETAALLSGKKVNDFHFYWIGENRWDNDTSFGQPCYWEEIEQIMQQKKLQKHITFLGVKENIFDYYIASDIFYLPSREDPFPLVCLEAAQCGLPIICFDDAGGMPEFVGNDAGMVLPFEDIQKASEGIFYLINRPDELKTLGANAKRKVLSRHILDDSAPEILRIISKIANFHPFVSIIVPNFNAVEYLKIRLDSIFNQTFRNFEVIILDDFSTDNSLNIIYEYLNYPNVKLIKNESNSGNPFSQWNKGLIEAKGEIIWIAESDDNCEPDFLTKLLPAFNDALVALSYCNSTIIDEFGNPNGDYNDYLNSLDKLHWKSSYQVTGEEEINFGLGIKNSIPNISAVLLRRNLLTLDVMKEVVTYRFSGDWFLYSKIIKGKQIVFNHEKLNYHRKHSKTLTSSFNTKKDYIDVLLDEMSRIHFSVIENFHVSEHFFGRWQKNVAAQLLAFYPESNREVFDRYFPYSKILWEMERLNEKNRPKRIIFLTTNDGSANGGSEQLYKQVAFECKKRGFDVMVVIKRWHPEPEFISNLRDNGVRITFKEHRYEDVVLDFKPELVVISIGDQDEGIEWYERCYQNNIPYVIVNHLTKEPLFWPVKHNINDFVRTGNLRAKKVLFTGINNRDVMEKRLSVKIPNSDIFFNPLDVKRSTSLPFPSLENGLQIAIPANLATGHKGQHLAIEIFSKKKWINRPIHLNIYGKGHDEDLLKNMILKKNLKNVTLHGHTEDILDVWKRNHAIFLTSFMEGLPLVLVGAMICGRVSIVTDVGANSEVITNNINGFIASKPTLTLIDEALERAFQRSSEWEEIGLKAKKSILNYIPLDPIDHFIGLINPILQEE